MLLENLYFAQIRYGCWLDRSDLSCSSFFFHFHFSLWVAWITEDGNKNLFVVGSCLQMYRNYGHEMKGWGVCLLGFLFLSSLYFLDSVWIKDMVEQKKKQKESESWWIQWLKFSLFFLLFISLHRTLSWSLIQIETWSSFEW